MANNALKFGRYYEDFTVGDIYKHWPGKTITESDNNLFSLLTMNHHPVHLDVKYAESKNDRGVVYVETIGYNQNDDKIISFRRKVLIPVKG